MILDIYRYPIAPSDTIMLISSFLGLTILDDVPSGPNTPQGWTQHTSRLALRLLDGNVLTWTPNNGDHP